MIDNLTIEKIKGACWVGDFMEEDGARLQKKGVNWLCLCPFHNDRHLGGFVVDGRRDRFTCFSCGAHGNSIDYLMKHRGMTFIESIRYAAATYGIEVGELPVKMPAKKLKAHVAPPELPALEIPIEVVKMKADYREDTLVKWIKSLPWSDEQKEWIDTMLFGYMVGHGKEGHTIFWQMDEKGKIRTGKMMKYKPDGHRDKDSEHNFDWIHAVLLRAGAWSDKQYDYKTVLFGLHLMPLRPNATINIVESEKTALICSIAYKGFNDYVWMATGGMQFFDRKHLQPLIDAERKIVCYPDRDGVKVWKDKAKQIGYENLFIDTTVMDKYWTPADGEKADIADVLVRLLKTSPEITTTDFYDKYPLMKELADKLDLEIL